MPFYILKFIFVMWSFFFKKGNILTFVALLSFLAVLKKRRKKKKKAFLKKILPCSGYRDLRVGRRSNGVLTLMRLLKWKSEGSKIRAVVQSSRVSFSS